MIKDLLKAIKHGWGCFKWMYDDLKHTRKYGCPEYLDESKKPF